MGLGWVEVPISTSVAVPPTLLDGPQVSHLLNPALEPTPLELAFRFAATGYPMVLLEFFINLSHRNLGTLQINRVMLQM